MNEVSPTAASIGLCRIDVEVPEAFVVTMHQIVDKDSPILEYRDLSELVAAILSESPLLAFLGDLNRTLIELRVASRPGSDKKVTSDNVGMSADTTQLPLDRWDEVVID